MTATTNPLLAAALGYAAGGLPVLPLHDVPEPGRCACGCADPACGSRGKHPRRAPGFFEHGVSEASTGPARIEAFWRRWPAANVGIAAGRGLLVLDVDPRHGGEDALAALEAAHAPLPLTVTCLTGSGGAHYYFRAPAGFEPGNSAGRLGAGLDVRGAGGFVVAPPSRHHSGRSYEWEAGRAPGETEIAPVPEWLLALLAGLGGRGGSAPGAAASSVAGPILEGARNATLTSLAGSMRRRGLTAAEMLPTLAAVDDARCRPPLGAEEVRRIAESVTRYAPAPANAGRFGSLAPGGSVGYPMTDSGNAELFAAVNADALRFDHARGRWLLWGGHRWRPDADGELYRLAVDCARLRYSEAPGIEDSAERKKAAAWALASESAPKLDAALKVARALRPLADDGANWDRDPWLLGVANGVVDLKTGALRPGKQDDRITMQSAVAFAPGATCPRWERFLAEVFAGDVEVLAFVQRAAGYSLTGSTREQCLFLAQGAGSNGKSTLLEVLRELLGDYAANLPFSALELRERNAGTFDIAGLEARRLVTSAETNEGSTLNAARVKALTGGDPVTAAHKYRDFRTFMPVAKFWLAVNHLPRVDDDSEGFWRRIRLIRFGERFEPGREPDLRERLRGELPGILVWAVRGCLQWQQEGLRPPEQVMLETWRWREEADPLAAFLQERCVIRPGATMASGAAFRAYSEWADAQRLPLAERLSAQMFGRRMRERFDGPRQAGTGTRLYHGIGLSVTDVTDIGRFQRVSPEESSREDLPEKPSLSVTPVTEATATPCARGCGRPSVGGRACFRCAEER